jgi:hypothetical protein
MAGARIQIKDRKQNGNSARKRIGCACAAAALLVLALLFPLDRNTMTVAPVGSTEAIDFSSLAATVIPLDEFGANRKGSLVLVTSILALSATSGMKSDFTQMTSVSGLVSKHAAKLQRHLERGARNRGSGPAVLAASWRPSTP